MKRSALFVVSALMAGAVTLPAFAAGTNEKNPDSAATGMTGTGSNALDPNANASTGASTIVYPANPPAVVVTPAPSGTIVAPAGSVVYPANPGTTIVTPAPAGTIVYPLDTRDSGAAINHGAVGGESAGKSGDSPGS